MNRSAKVRNLSLSAIAAMALATTVISPAYADQADSDNAIAVDAAQSSIQQLRASEPSLLSEPVANASSTALGDAILLENGSITIPSDQSSDLTLTSPDGKDIGIALPVDGAGGEPAQLADGSAVFTGEDSSTTVVPNAASVQLISTIENADAPTRYEYDFSLQEGQSLRVVDDIPSVVNADGSLEYVIADPWAKDATGAEVPTHYEIEGDTLVQVVQHDVEGTIYPVVADPAAIPFFVYKCLLGLGLKGPEIVNAWATGTIWGGLGRAALACALGK